MNIQHAQLISELFYEYAVYFPKCYRIFIKKEPNPNNHYLLVNKNEIYYSDSNKTIYIDELEDISNCYVCLQPGQNREHYLTNLFQYIIKRYKWTEDTVEEIYNNKSEDSDW